MIDAHVHVFTRVSSQYPRETSTLAQPEREAPAERLLETMKEAGVSKAVLIQLGGYRENHRYLADCLRRFPNLFAGVGLVDPQFPRPERELAELVNSTGIKGIRVHTLGVPGTRDVKRLPAYPLFKRADELGIVVCVYAHSDQAEFFQPLKREFPDLTVAFDHLGMCPSNFSVDRFRRPHIDTELPPPTLRTILEMARHENVYVKLSGDYAFSHLPYPYPDMKPLYEALYRSYGADRLMWATDFPWILEEPGYAELTRLIDHHLPDLTAAERESIITSTAARVWRL